MKNTKFRIYGKTLNTWKSENEYGISNAIQYEIAYREYDENGELVATGSEDFSIDRYYKTMMDKFVYIWDGEKRNKGGKRFFKYMGRTLYQHKDAKSVKNYYKNLYNASVVELR